MIYDLIDFFRRILSFDLVVAKTGQKHSKDKKKTTMIFVLSPTFLLLCVINVKFNVNAVALQSPFDWLALRDLFRQVSLVRDVTPRNATDVERERRLGTLSPPDCPYDGPSRLFFFLSFCLSSLEC